MLAQVALALAFAAIANLPLSYDGAYFFFHVLDTRTPDTPNGRLLNVPLQFPTLIASAYTHNFTILRIIFSATYAAVPLFSLVASWRVCRRRAPARFVWAALSICLAALPGQMAFVFESNEGASLLWPALLYAIGDFPIAQLPVVILTTTAAWWSHPTLAVHLLFIAIAAGLSAMKRPSHRTPRYLFASVMLLAGIARAIQPLRPYEAKTLSFQVIRSTFYSAVWGWPLLNAALTLAAAATLRWLYSREERGGDSRIATLLIVLAGTALVPWAANATSWSDAAGYRFWYPGLLLVLMLLATAESLQETPLKENAAICQRPFCLIATGSVFLVVLSIQSLVWRNLTVDLVNTMKDRRCVSRNEIGALKQTALGHWGTDYYAIDLQSRTPTTLILEDEDCAMLAATGKLRLSSEAAIRPEQDGWFNFSAVRDHLRR